MWYIILTQTSHSSTNPATKRPPNNPLKSRSGEQQMPRETKWNSSADTHSPPLNSILRVIFFLFMAVWFSRFHPPNNISSTVTLPLETLSPDPSPLTEPIAVTLSSLGPGPLGTSPDCCLPGTYFLCPIPPSSHPKVPPPAGTGATLRTSTARLGFVLPCTADSI